MKGKLGIWAAWTAVIVVALMFGAVATSVANAPRITTYNVFVSEVGLPSGTSWSVTVDGIIGTGTTSTLKVTGEPAASFYFYPPTVAGASSVQYVPSYSYIYVTVPNVEHITIAYTTQYYTTFSLSPTSGGTTTPGTGWINAGSSFAIAAQPAYGYSFSSWSSSPVGAVVFAKASQESTEATVSAVATIQAAFTVGTTKTTFDEVGLPASTTWKVVFNTVTFSGATTSIQTSAYAPSSYAWSIAPVAAGTGIQYAPTPASGYITVPLQPSQEIVFTKQYQVKWVVSGTGSVSPSGSVYYNAGTNLPILATPGSGNVFSTWSTTQTKVGLGGNLKAAGTNATVKAAGTVTAKFKGGSQCSSCTLTFTEVGLPSGTPWGVTFNNVQHTSPSSKVTLTSLTTSASWGAFTPVGVGIWGISYQPVGTSSGYWTVGSTTSIGIVYAEFAYLTVSSNPSGYLYGAGQTISTGWYPTGIMNPLSAYNGTNYNFGSYASSGLNVTLGSTSTSSTTLTLTGPGTLFANFVQPHATLHFQEYGLPKGTTWGFTLSWGASTYYSSNSPWINVTGVPSGTYSWTGLSNINGSKAGVEWSPPVASGSVYLPFQTYAGVVYVEQFLVSFATSGTNIGTILAPASTATWFWTGSILPLIAQNASAGKFSSWSPSTGTATIASTSSAATTMTITGTGTITAKFK